MKGVLKIGILQGSVDLRLIFNMTMSLVYRSGPKDSPGRSTQSELADRTTSIEGLCPEDYARPPKKKVPAVYHPQIIVVKSPAHVHEPYSISLRMYI